MRTVSAVVHPETGADEQAKKVEAIISRVESLMKDGRYPPLYPCRVSLHIPFLIKYRRP